MKLREIQYSEDGLTPVDCPMCGMPSGNVVMACDACFQAQVKHLGHIPYGSLASQREWFYDRGVQLRAEGKMPPLAKPLPIVGLPVAKCGVPRCVSLHEYGSIDYHIAADGGTWWGKAKEQTVEPVADAALSGALARQAQRRVERQEISTATSDLGLMTIEEFLEMCSAHASKALTPPPGIVATGAIACAFCGKRIGVGATLVASSGAPGDAFCSTACATEARTIRRGLVGCTEPNCIATHANGSKMHTFPALGPVILGGMLVPAAICPLRWCGRHVPEHTEAEVTRCAEYRGRLRVIEERLSKFQRRVALRDAEAGLMTPADVGSEVEWAKARTEEETETLRREWRALR